MRIHPWLAALSSVLLLFAAGESATRAQQVSSDIFQSGGSTEPLEGRVRLISASIPETTPDVGEIRGQSPGGVVFESAYGNQDPGVLWPQGTPQTYQPYPQISPYHPANVAVDTTFNRDGLWFREMLFRKRDYFLTLEYLMVRYREPGNAIVGAPTARYFRADPTSIGGGNTGTTTGGLVGIVVNNHGLAGPSEFGLDANPEGQRIVVGPGVFPFPYIFDTAAQNNRTAAFDETLFPIRSLSYFDNPLKTDGMRVRTGYFNEDGSGMMLTGWFGTEGHDRFKFGRDAYNGILVNQDFIEANSPTGGQAFVFPRNGALPLLTRPDFIANDVGHQDSLDDIGTLGFTGLSQKFDVLFQYDVRTFAAGGALHLYHEPLYRRKWVTVRPTFGARYQYLDERFNFRGIDSGFGYDPDVGATGNNQVPTYRPDSNDIFRVVDDVGNPFVGAEGYFEANLESQTYSHMAGPEAGVRYDFGSGKHFAIWGQSTVALLANHERTVLSGKNIGDPVNYWLVTQDNFADPTDGINTRFLRDKTHTHASPMFEQSVFIDMDVFRFIPLLKDMHVLENARFRTGYTYTVIGSVMRPAESIEWRAFPDFPTVLSDNRKTWSTHNWSFAFDWTF